MRTPLIFPTRLRIPALSVLLAFLPALPVLGQSAEVESETGASVKAHLSDGSVALFPDGLRLEREGTEAHLHGSGRSLPVSRVTALEFYNERLPREALHRTAARSASAPVDDLQSSAGLYAFDGSRFVLEAEAFSTNVLAAAEADDLDRLDAGVASGGAYRLRLSNRAWETQYVNALHLVAVDHEPGFEVWPTRKRELVLVGPTAPPARATSCDGRDVSALLSAQDGRTYRTASSVARQLAERITEDWVEFEVNVPRGVRTVYVTMHVRNTLFSNVLLEDALLTGHGLETLDLLGGERFRVLEMWRLHRWVRKHMGLRLLVDRNGRFESVDRIGGTGPSAWRRAVVQVPVRAAGPLRMRLSFLADSWMIDRVGVSFEGSDRVESTTIPVSALRTAAGASVSPEGLRANDKRYHAVYPGETLEATFRVGSPPAGQRRTYFAQTQGYFIKWMRPEQLMGSGGSFKPDDADVFRAARRWLARKAAMEQAFASAARPRM